MLAVVVWAVGRVEGFGWVAGACDAVICSMRGLKSLV